MHDKIKSELEKSIAQLQKVMDFVLVYDYDNIDLRNQISDWQEEMGEVIEGDE
jgi:hypothetical protein